MESPNSKRTQPNMPSAKGCFSLFLPPRVDAQFMRKEGVAASPPPPRSFPPHQFYARPPPQAVSPSAVSDLFPPRAANHHCASSLTVHPPSPPLPQVPARSRGGEGRGRGHGSSLNRQTPSPRQNLSARHVVFPSPWQPQSINHLNPGKRPSPTLAAARPLTEWRKRSY